MESIQVQGQHEFFSSLYQLILLLETSFALFPDRSTYPKAWAHNVYYKDSLFKFSKTIIRLIS